MKKKILIISDSPLAPSGVGTQTKYMIESMLRTGEFQFICLAGALKHPSYEPVRVSPYEDDWLIIPIDGYGNQNIIRAMIHQHRPDALWFMTDPRFYTWLWEIEDEIRDKVPMVYYHVWDNYPYPTFNKDYYDSNDVVCTISKLTDDIVRNVSPGVKCVHIPHTVDTSSFKKRQKEEYEDILAQQDNSFENKMVFFWNNRNARRKQSGTLIFWFKEFLDIIGKDKACLIMHTEPKDPHGQDLGAIIENLDLTNGEVLLSTTKVDSKTLSKFYNIADCTINISDAEGFGLGTLESLACETPIIVTMTGGLQEQVTDGEDWFGIGIDPKAKAIIGSQEVPWIFEDRITKEDFLEAMVKFYNTSKVDRDLWGQKGRSHVLKNYSMPKYAGLWYETFQNLFDESGSWETRKNYDSWELVEIK